MRSIIRLEIRNFRESKILHVTYTVRLAAEGNTARIGAGASGGTANVPDSVITLMEIAG